jgi:PAS domain S-box-containing protein
MENSASKPIERSKGNVSVTQDSAPSIMRILIVDDAETDRATYIRYLKTDKHQTYKFLEAETIEEGLELWRSQNPDIVLVDYELPDGNGLEILEAMRAENLMGKLGTIMLTGRGNERLAVQSMRLGAADYLVKGEITAVALYTRVGQVSDRLKISRQLQRSQQQELLIAKISLHIRQYLDLEEISNAIVQEVRAFLQADRTVIYQFNPDMSGMVVAESILPPWETCIHRQLSDEYFPENMGGEYREGRIFVAPDVYTANLSDCHLQMLEQFPTRASLIVPILRPNNKDNPLWGLLCTYQCFEPRLWDESDIRLLQQLSVQLAIALQQAELYHNLQINNAELENRVAERTAELYQRQQEFIALVENSPNVTMRLDLQMRHLYVNPVVERESGIKVEAFLGKTGREMGFPPENVTMIENAAQQLLETGKEQRFEIEQPLQQGKGMRYYQSHLIPEYAPDGKIATMLLIFYDITQNKLNELALQEANRRWQSLLDNVRLIVVGLSCDGLVEYINPFFLDSTGYTIEEVIGKDWFSHFLPQSTQENVKGAFSDSLIKSFQTHYQNPIVTKEGDERMIAWNNTTLCNQDNEIIGTLSIGEDITEKLKVERIKSEFISIASHELRTPLSSIRGALGLLASGVLDNQPETAKRMLDIASSDTERLVRLVNDILDLERLESSKVTLDRQWCDVTELCQQAVETMQAIATEKQIEILCNVQSHQIFADGDRLVQTLVNLLSNAIKFSPSQSQVQLESEAIGDDIIFRVRDYGRGIPENHLEIIFERFSQVDASDSRQMGGTGLGLAICRSIVQQHGGKIWVESVLSEGSTVSFTIPHRIS